MSYYVSTASTSTTYASHAWASIHAHPQHFPGVISKGQEMSFTLPDGGRFELSRDGSYRVIDKDAKITYAASRHRDFNRYMNASDMLEEFITYCVGLGMTQKEIIGVPVELFIAFLVVRAAEKDGEEVPVEHKARLEQAPMLSLPPPMGKPRCRKCGVFIARVKRDAGMPYCNSTHAANYFQSMFGT